MNEVEIEQIRQKLLHLRSELQELEKISKETSGPVELDQSKVGRLSRIDAMQAQQMALEAARRRQGNNAGVDQVERRSDHRHVRQLPQQDLNRRESVDHGGWRARDADPFPAKTAGDHEAPRQDYRPGSDPEGV